MTESAKINLSHKELELVCNSDWIFTKHKIIEKVYQLLANTLMHMQDAAKQEAALLPAEFFSVAPKIYKGENYRLLPYVMLDYPRYFLKEDMLAVRTLFWWGNFFSVTLHVSGKFKSNIENNIVQAFSFLQQHQYWIGVGETSWEHHFENNNYQLVSELTAEEFTAIIINKEFMKLAKKLPLQQWNAAEMFIDKCFDEMLLLLAQSV